MGLDLTDLCVPIPLTNELRKTTKDHWCRKLQLQRVHGEALVQAQGGRPWKLY